MKFVIIFVAALIAVAVAKPAGKSGDAEITEFDNEFEDRKSYKFG